MLPEKEGIEVSLIFSRYLIVAEVASRMNTLESFVKLVEMVGYTLKRKDVKNSYFVLLIFRKVKAIVGIEDKKLQVTRNQQKELGYPGKENYTFESIS